MKLFILNLHSQKVSGYVADIILIVLVAVQQNL